MFDDIWIARKNAQGRSFHARCANIKTGRTYRIVRRQPTEAIKIKPCDFR